MFILVAEILVSRFHLSSWITYLAFCNTIQRTLLFIIYAYNENVCVVTRMAYCDMISQFIVM